MTAWVVEQRTAYDGCGASSAWRRAAYAGMRLAGKRDVRISI
ncbi:hypothetical protein A3768_1290 [Ralstonia solanacearum]|nr:hypothetical protein F504_2217 [Ralstonia pseudosolanacearum FQY_4]ANH32453.1 hypothetical protein A3768_1290 [Ralstonia solanacearum]